MNIYTQLYIQYYGIIISVAAFLQLKNTKNCTVAIFLKIFANKKHRSDCLFVIFIKV